MPAHRSAGRELSNSVVLFTDEDIEDQVIKLHVLCQFNFLEDDRSAVRPAVGMCVCVFVWLLGL